MSIHSPFKLFVGGCSLITSCSIWLFEPSKNPPVAAMTLNDSSSPGPIKLDLLNPVGKLPDWQGKPMVDDNIEVSKHSDGSSLVLKFKDKSKQDAILTVMNTKIDSFYVYGNSTKEAYEKFDKNKIKIKLFKNPAWYSSNKVEEYEALEDSQVKELFKDVEEVRVKQLLLALSHKVEWLKYGSSTDNMFYMNVVFAYGLDGLEDLKIRHFNDFTRLKDYVKKKVATCKDDTTACYPTPEEIDYLEMDKKEYFESIK